MKFTDSQKTQIAAWVAEGLSLAQIQTKIADELGVALTYMEVRFLVDDLNLELRDKPESPKKSAAPAPNAAPETKNASEADGNAETAAKNAETAANAAAADGNAEANGNASEAAEAPAAGKVSLSSDALQVPGVLAGGDVTFSDGTRGKWFVDEVGRPGLSGFPKGYRPPAADMPEFQRLLVQELRKFGLC